LPAGIGILLSRFSVELLGVSLSALAVALIVLQAVAAPRSAPVGTPADS
jgi:hypothetical protein